MKIAAMADCHIDHGVHKLNGYKSWERSCKYIAEHKIDACIIAGDMFHTGKANGEATCVASNGISMMADSGCEVLIVAGNHEWQNIRPPREKCLTIEAFNDLKGVSVVTKPSLVRLKGGELLVAAMPWEMPGWGKPVAEASDILAEKMSAHSGPRIAAAHALAAGTKSKVKRGTEIDMTPFLNDGAVPINILDRPNEFTHTILGHIHLRQSFSDSCSYVGSLGAINFSDEGQEKGFSTYEWDDDTQRWEEKFIPIKTHKFQTIDYDQDLEELDKDTLVRVELREGEQAHKDFRDKIFESGSRFITWQKPKGKEQDELLEDISHAADMAGYGDFTMENTELLERWAVDKNLTKDEREDMWREAENVLGWKEELVD